MPHYPTPASRPRPAPRSTPSRTTDPLDTRAAVLDRYARYRCIERLAAGAEIADTRAALVVHDIIDTYLAITERAQ